MDTFIEEGNTFQLSSSIWICPDISRLLHLSISFPLSLMMFPHVAENKVLVHAIVVIATNNQLGRSLDLLQHVKRSMVLTDGAFVSQVAAVY